MSTISFSRRADDLLSPSYDLNSYSSANAGLSLYDSGAALDYSAYGDSSVSQVANDLLTLNSSSAGSAVYNSYSASASAGASSDLLALSGANASSGRRILSYGISEAEAAILRSNRPPEFAANEEITVNGQRGLWTNKNEVLNWRGPISINQYAINQDSNPEIIRKQTDQQLTYVQDLAVRYLRPPTPPAPGEIIITQQPNTVIPPAPPVVIRQVPPRPITPPPLVLREAPPQAPARVGRKLISISGKVIPPPPRKVVVERLAPLPNKPQAVFVERWLPYSQVKRRVIFQKSNQVDPIVVKPRNVIVQWDAPKVQVRREVRNLGVVRANPVEYVQRYGASLRNVSQFPAIAASIRPPQGVILAADYRYNPVHELYGDVQALSLIDLEREGLGAYSGYLARLGVNQGLSISSSSASAYSTNKAIIDAVFATIDRDSNGRISVQEAQRAFYTVNARLGKSYSDADIASFFASFDYNQDGFIDYDEFKSAFEGLTLL